MVDRQKGAQSPVDRHTQALEDAAIAARTTSSLLLAQQLGLDMRDPVSAQQVIRALNSIERYVRRNNND
jgi:hypothetical protein